jgi:Zn ribbon nucleic-acid-binding protein
MNGGKMEDGTSFVAIGNGEPEAKKFIVHTECPKCGKQHYFDFWAMFRGEWITCEHCGNRSRAEVRKVEDL